MVCIDLNKKVIKFHSRLTLLEQYLWLSKMYRLNPWMNK